MIDKLTELIADNIMLFAIASFWLSILVLGWAFLISATRLRERDGRD